MNQKQQLEKDIQALEAKLNEMKATVEAMPSEAPARWVPGGEESYVRVAYHNGDIQYTHWANTPADRFCLFIGNVHRTKEDAENYRLRLESFVPALGPETPSMEVLNSGFCPDWCDGKIRSIEGFLPVPAREAYLSGQWQPTREAAEEWLAKYGKVRGYVK